MHTLKVHMIEVTDPNATFEELREKLAENLLNKPIMRKRIVPVPFGIHHPVMVDDPDFDINAHIFRAAIPAPGTMRELDDMVAQLASTRLDRSRPLWEMWILEGLESGHIAVVHKIHHAMADGMAYVGFLCSGWDGSAGEPTISAPAPPLPGNFRLLWDALKDHLTGDIWNLWPILRSFFGNLKELSNRSKAATVPRVNPLTAKYPRTRFNYALGVMRSYSTCQLSLSEVKALKNKLGVTLNDIILAISAGALREYLLFHDELPSGPLGLSIPVGADEPGSTRQMGNNVTTLFSQLHTELADPLERLQAINRVTEQGKSDLEVFGKHQWGDLMEYVPPGLMSWYCRRNFRKKPANKPNFRPNANVVVSNVPGPRELLGTEDGKLAALYSVGVLGEGMGLNITLWSYADQLNVGLLACQKAMPDLQRLKDAFPRAVAELQQAAAEAAATAETDADAHT